VGKRGKPSPSSFTLLADKDWPVISKIGQDARLSISFALLESLYQYNTYIQTNPHTNVHIGSGTLKWPADPYYPTTFSMLMAGHFSVPLPIPTYTTRPADSRPRELSSRLLASSPEAGANFPLSPHFPPKCDFFQNNL